LTPRQEAARKLLAQTSTAKGRARLDSDVVYRAFGAHVPSSLKESLTGNTHSTDALFQRFAGDWQVAEAQDFGRSQFRITLRHRKSGKEIRAIDSNENLARAKALILVQMED
jgi:hypothetical protein